MHFALIKNNRTKAQPYLQGLCCCCSKVVIAKCGTRKIWHWAHKSKTDCDNWWEPETEWHRTWKNNFPEEWQEISAIHSFGRVFKHFPRRIYITNKVRRKRL